MKKKRRIPTRKDGTNERCAHLRAECLVALVLVVYAVKPMGCGTNRQGSANAVRLDGAAFGATVAKRHRGELCMDLDANEWCWCQPLSPVVFTCGALRQMPQMLLNVATGWWS